MSRTNKKRAFVLMWNPEVSNINVDQWARVVNHFQFEDLSWSVWDYKKANWGDRCYMVRVGNGNTGIVMKGSFASYPKRGSDWSGKGRTVFYCDLSIQHILDSERHSIITTEELQREIPTFDWTGGHSGRMLTRKETSKLDCLWEKYIAANQILIEQQRQQSYINIEKAAADKIIGFEHLINYFKEYWDDSYLDNPECVYSEDYYGDTCNLGFCCDYEKSEFRLKYMLQGAVLPIICKKPHVLKMNLDDGSCFLDWFRIYLVNEEHLKLEANGVEVICDEIHFSPVKKFTKKGYPVSI
ncbi:MAG: hypothetical protein E7091_04040 [Bacteroidales bacterium]|nr:hypothetical protein [Bacteroidales bacterium]